MREQDRVKVSVIIPVYNAGKYLRECLDTLVWQTLKEIEIILIDDGSSDNSLKICQEYGRLDSRVRVYTQKKQGAWATCNSGINLARGEYLSFLDANDFFELEMLEKLYNRCISANSEICVCRSKSINNSRVEAIPQALRKEYLWKDVFSFRDPFYTEHLYQIFMGWTWDKLFKRSLIDRYCIKYPNLCHLEDFVFVFAAMAVAEQIAVIDDELVFHRCYANSLGSNHDVYPADFMNAILIHCDYLMRSGIYEAYRNSLISWICSFSGFYYRSAYSTSTRQTIINCIKEIAEKLSFDEKKCWNQLDRELRIPKVSVVIPVYNVEKFLDRAMKSVIQQTLYDIEIICINDGSTDHSLEILQKYQHQDPRVKILNKVNTGYGHSVNIGMQMANGEYVAILEPDDYIKQDMYEVLYKKAKDFNLDFIKSDFYRIDGTESKPEISYKSAFEKNSYDRIINPQKEPVKPIQICTWNGLYKRVFLSQNRILHNETPGASYQDNGFFLKTFYYATRIMIIKKAFYMYNRVNMNASSQLSYKLDKLICEFDLDYCFFKEHPYNKNIFELLLEKRTKAFLWALATVDKQNRSKCLSKLHELFTDYYHVGELIQKYYTANEWQKILDLISIQG